MKKLAAYFKTLHLCFFLILSLHCMSQSTWTGNGDGINWTDAANWDMGVPAHVGDADIPAGLTATIPMGTTVDWTPSDLTGGGILINEGEIHFSGFFQKEVVGGTEIINNGRILIADGTLWINDGSVINNGTIEFTANSDNIQFSSGSEHDLTNNGLILKSGGVGVSAIEVDLTNKGTIQVDVGELRLLQSDTFQTGTNLIAATGAKIIFDNDRHLFDGSIVGQGDGEILMETDIEVTSTAVVDVEGNGMICKACNFVGGGTIEFSDALRFQISFNNFILENTTVYINDTAYFESGLLFIDNGTLENHGVITFPGDGADLTSNAGALKSDFYNYGTVVKSGGSGSTVINVKTVHRGIMRVDSGTLRFNGSFSDFDSTLESIFEGSGEFELTGGTQALGGTISPGGPGTVGTLTWTGPLVRMHLNADIGSSTADYLIFTSPLAAITHFRSLSINMLDKSPGAKLVSNANFGGDESGGCVGDLMMLNKRFPPELGIWNDTAYLFDPKFTALDIDGSVPHEFRVINVGQIPVEDVYTITDLENSDQLGQYGTISQAANSGDTIRVDPSLNGSVIRPGFIVNQTLLCSGGNRVPAEVELPLTYYADPLQNLTIKDTLNPFTFPPASHIETLPSYTDGIVTYDGFDLLIQGEVNFEVTYKMLRLFNYDMVYRNGTISLDPTSGLDGIIVGETIPFQSPPPTGSITLGPGTVIDP